MHLGDFLYPFSAALITGFGVLGLGFATGREIKMESLDVDFAVLTGVLIGVIVLAS